MAAYQEIESPPEDRGRRLHSVIEVDGSVPIKSGDDCTIANVAGNIDQIGLGESFLALYRRRDLQVIGSACCWGGQQHARLGDRVTSKSQDGEW